MSDLLWRRRSISDATLDAESSLLRRRYNKTEEDIIDTHTQLAKDSELSLSSCINACSVVVTPVLLLHKHV